MHALKERINWRWPRGWKRWVGLLILFVAGFGISQLLQPLSTAIASVLPPPDWFPASQHPFKEVNSLEDALPGVVFKGWYNESLPSNLGLMFVQYLSPMLIFMGVTLISIYWSRFGGLLHIIFALLAAWFFQPFSNAATLLIIMPLIGLGVLYWFGRPQPRRMAVSLAIEQTWNNIAVGLMVIRTKRLKQK